MTEDDVDEAMQLNSAELVGEVYDTTRRNVENFSQKLARLDTKATSLMGVIGLSLTIVFTYGGQLVFLHKKDIQALGAIRWGVLVSALTAASLSGVAAGILAAMALLVRDHFEMSERAVYNKKALRDADAIAHEQSGAAAVADYRRHMTLHMWNIIKQREGKMIDKAKFIRYGQYCFFAFIGSLMVVFLEVVTRMVII